MMGGLGDDIYYVDSTSGDSIVDTGGTDLVYASVSYSMKDGSNAENLTLLGTGNTNGLGNYLDNIITGTTGRNTLDGKCGNDTLIGLTGNDTYFVDSSLDVVVEALGEGTDLVRAGVLSVDDINSVPLSQEIIDSVLQHFPQDTSCRAMGLRLRETLEALRDLEQESMAETLDYAESGARASALKN